MPESLAVKYRPHDFDDGVCGQDSVVKILKKQIELKDYKHCYIFCGSSGCGKTTLARILASKINGSLDGLEEMDAASNNGVENVRNIVKSAQERSISSKYKIFLIDECFTGDTLISTSQGCKRIDEVSIGDEILSITGKTTVKGIHSKIISSDRMCSVTLSNGKKISCTKDHLVMTTKGYIRAAELVKGDEIIDAENMRNVWENIRGTESTRSRMFEEVCRRDGEKKPGLPKKFKEVYTQLCDLWEDMDRHSYKSATNLFTYLLLDPTITETETTLCISRRGVEEEIVFTKSEGDCRVWNSYQRTEESFVKKNARKQSNAQFENKGKDDRNKTEEWDTRLGGKTRRKRTYNCSTTEAIRRIRKFLEAGISSQNTLSSEKRIPLSNVLQVRPCLSRENDWDRGGWQFPQIERVTITRYEKDTTSKPVRVESVEIYEQRNNGKCGTSSSKDTRVYDLTVEGHPSYFANGVLVHNCHSLTNAAWQAFLKCIEEPPEYTIFMFCTTDPEKIPQTIVNRCQRYNISKISSDLISSRLSYICRCEGYTNFEETVEYLAKISNGGMRDAIASLEKVASYDTDMSIDKAMNALGTYSYQMFFKLVNDIIDCKQDEVLKTISSIYYEGKDLKLFVEQFFSFCLDVTKYCLFKTTDLLEIPASQEEALKLSTNFENAEKYYMVIVDKLLSLKNSIKNDSSPRTTVEAVFLNITRWE